MTACTEVTVPPTLQPYVGPLLARLGYLYPEAQFSQINDVLVVTQPSGGSISHREMMHQLYREKIYQETLTMREHMYRAILA